MSFWKKKPIKAPPTSNDPRSPSYQWPSYTDIQKMKNNERRGLVDADVQAFFVQGEARRKEIPGYNKMGFAYDEDFWRQAFVFLGRLKIEGPKTAQKRAAKLESELKWMLTQAQRLDAKDQATKAAKAAKRKETKWMNLGVDSGSQVPF